MYSHIWKILFQGEKNDVKIGSCKNFRKVKSPSFRYQITRTSFTCIENSCLHFNHLQPGYHCLNRRTCSLQLLFILFPLGRKGLNDSLGFVVHCAWNMFLNVVMMHTVQACYTGVTHSPYTTRWSKTYIWLGGGICCSCVCSIYFVVQSPLNLFVIEKDGGGRSFFKVYVAIRILHAQNIKTYTQYINWPLHSAIFIRYMYYNWVVSHYLLL